MTTQSRKSYSPEQKVAIIRLHLLENVPVSEHPLWHLARLRPQIIHETATKDRSLSPIDDLVDDNLFPQPRMPRIENLKPGIMGV